MSTLASLTRRVAVAEAVVLLVGAVLVHGLAAVDSRALAAAAGALWGIQVAAFAGVAARGSRALSAARAARTSTAGERATVAAVRLPAAGLGAVLLAGATGIGAAAATRFASGHLPADVAVALGGIGLGASLLGALIAFALCTAAVPGLLARIGAESAPRGASIRRKILLLCLGLDASAMLLVVPAAYLRHREAVLPIAAFVPGDAALQQLRPFAASLLLAALVAFLGAAVLAWLFADAIARPVGALGLAADRLAAGDLTASPGSVSSDEMGLLAGQFRRMAQGLGALVREVQAASENVSSGAAEAGSIGEQVRVGALEQRAGVHTVQAAVEGMAGSMARVSSGMETLSEYVAAASRSTGEMTDAFGQVQKKGAELERARAAALRDVEGLASAGREAEARLTALETLAATTGGTLAEVKASVAALERTAGETEETTAAVALSAERARTVLEETAHGIGQLRRAVAEAHERIAGLRQRSDDIDRVVDFISEVAGRTNLLSLNASIIAAQAGEQGKVFAVVADQIRELAAQIARSTKSIGDILRAVREDVEGTATLVHRGDALAVESVDRSRNSLAALDEIRASAARGRETTGEIRTAVRRHAHSSREVANLVERVAESSQAVAGAVQLAGRSLGGVHSVSRGVNGMAEGVARALEEQAAVAQRQRDDLARLEATLQDIALAVKEHQAGTQAVKSALDALSSTADRHESAVGGLSGLSDRIGTRARTLAERVNRFRV